MAQWKDPFALFPLRFLIARGEHSRRPVGTFESAWPRIPGRLNIAQNPLPGPAFRPRLYKLSSPASHQIQLISYTNSEGILAQKALPFKFLGNSTNFGKRPLSGNRRIFKKCEGWGLLHQELFSILINPPRSESVKTLENVKTIT